MDNDEDLLVAMLGITLFLSVIVLRRRRMDRKYWVNPYSRQQTGRFFTGVSFNETFKRRTQIFKMNDNYSFRI